MTKREDYNYYEKAIKIWNNKRQRARGNNYLFISRKAKFDVLIINLSTIFFINSTLIKYQNGPRPSKPLKV